MLCGELFGQRSPFCEHSIDRLAEPTFLGSPLVQPLPVATLGLAQPFADVGEALLGD